MIRCNLVIMVGQDLWPSSITLKLDLDNNVSIFHILSIITYINEFRWVAKSEESQETRLNIDIIAIPPPCATLIKKAKIKQHKAVKP